MGEESSSENPEHRSDISACRSGMMRGDLVEGKESINSWPKDGMSESDDSGGGIH